MTLIQVIVLLAICCVTICSFSSTKNIEFECKNGAYRILVSLDDDTEIIEYDILRRKTGEVSFLSFYSSNKMTLQQGNVLEIDIGFIGKHSDCQYKLSITTGDEMKINYDPFFWDQEKNNFMCLKS